MHNVIDDFKREALATEVDLSLPAERFLCASGNVIELGGKPKATLYDSCPQYTGDTVMQWAEPRGTQLVHA